MYLLAIEENILITENQVLKKLQSTHNVLKLAWYLSTSVYPALCGVQWEAINIVLKPNIYNTTYILYLKKTYKNFNEAGFEPAHLANCTMVLTAKPWVLHNAYILYYLFLYLNNFSIGGIWLMPTRHYYRGCVGSMGSTNYKNLTNLAFRSNSPTMYEIIYQYKIAMTSVHVNIINY